MEHSDNASETAPVGEGGSLNDMDRRKFLHSLLGGVAAASAVRTWPFRVYSFPSNIVIADTPLPFIPYLKCYPGVLGLAHAQEERQGLVTQGGGVEAAVKAFLEGKYKREAELRRQEARARIDLTPSNYHFFAP